MYQIYCKTLVPRQLQRKYLLMKCMVCLANSLGRSYCVDNHRPNDIQNKTMVFRCLCMARKMWKNAVLGRNAPTHFLFRSTFGTVQNPCTYQESFCPGQLNLLLRSLFEPKDFCTCMQETRIKVLPFYWESKKRTEKWRREACWWQCCFLAARSFQGKTSQPLHNIWHFQSSKFAQWQDHYLRGAGMEMYTEHFSEAFHGQSFPAAAE